MPDLAGIEEENDESEENNTKVQVQNLKSLKDLDEFNKVNDEKDGSGSARANFNPQPAQSMMNYPSYMINS
tara:strand:- start:477 stop:689 length:213 start_codon:yes stop_codon:yes gene_type:complete